MGHDASCSHDHGHGPVAQVQEESNSWGWAPFLLGVTFLMTIVLLPLVHFQGK